MTAISSRTGPVYCTCSDPDYCLRNAGFPHRQRAIEYRRSVGAPLPKDAKNGSEATA